MCVPKTEEGNEKAAEALRLLAALGSSVSRALYRSHSSPIHENFYPFE